MSRTLVRQRSSLVVANNPHIRQRDYRIRIRTSPAQESEGVFGTEPQSRGALRSLAPWMRRRILHIYESYRGSVVKDLAQNPLEFLVGHRTAAWKAKASAE